MSQRLVINLKNGSGVAGGVKKAVFNADDIFAASAISDGFNDNTVNLYTSEGKYFTLTCASTSVVNSYCYRISDASASTG